MTSVAVHRVEVRTKRELADGGPRGAAVCREAGTLGLSASPQRVDVAAVYLIEGALSSKQIDQVARELLADPVTEEPIIGSSPVNADATIEVHPLPGVMDPDGEAVKLAIHSMLGVEVDVHTGRRYDLYGTDRDAAKTIAERCLANPVIHAIHEQPYHPAELPHGRPYELHIVTVPLRDLDDAALERLSREAHLFLSLEEMKAIQREYRELGRDPREIELETLAQTWSEHCVHKTLKATMTYREQSAGGPGMAMPGLSRHERNPDGSITIHNLLKSTVAAATHELIADGVDWCLSVFVDNSGVIAFDEKHAVCFKVETHNHPSAIEPYGGAATGIGGCIRDIIGTGLGARPIAATDVFCVAFPDHFDFDAASGFAPASDDRALTRSRKRLPAGVLHPRRILTQVVAGVRDYGNRMGIPTLNGAVWFDDDYLGNPLVFCGCVGVMPRDKVRGAASRGDRIVAVGGRTGRDGIHGATFSSAELTDTHADEFAHAVQIGNPVTEKKTLDAILAARDHAGGCLYSAITDCGAGGFSSAVGEMGAELGADVHLDRAPLKYEGLSPTEIWISEAQERMVLAVPPEKMDALRAIFEAHDVEMADLGHFGTDGAELILHYRGVEVGRLPMEFLHEGIPQRRLEAVWAPRDDFSEESARRDVGKPRSGSLQNALLTLLAHPNIASKHWIIRQYDHEVQGNTVVKPIVGPRNGPSDAAVITPVDGSNRGLGIACGLATGLRDDPYLMTLAAIDECVRNLVCVGVDPSRIAILDNFSWPGVNDPHSLGALVRAAVGCYDGAKAYRTPFISGKDSLNNQFTTEDGNTIRIPPTLLISGFGIVHDVRRCVTMDAKAAGNALVLVGVETRGVFGGSHFERVFGDGRVREAASGLPVIDLERGPRAAAIVHRLINDGLVRAAHDCSDGGILVAAAEMAFAADLGLRMHLAGRDVAWWFCEEPSRYLLEVEPHDVQRVRDVAADAGLSCEMLGEFNDSGRFTIDGEIDVSINELRSAWRGTLDW